MKTRVIGSKGYIGSELIRYIGGDGIDRGDEWDIEGYDTIILLAGHSSMQMGRDDPDGAWQNNVVNFKALLDKLKDNQRLIYASSASVYNNLEYATEDTKAVDVMNMYDLSKWIIDQLAIQSGKHTYGLRFATVNGFSRILRVDLMMNKMVEAVRNEGVVNVKNAQLPRPILGIQDCIRAIEAIVFCEEDRRGIYNLCSINHTVKEYAEAVVAKFGGKVVDLGEEPHYVYGCDTEKFENTFDFQFEETIESILDSLDRKPLKKVVRVIK